MTMSNTEQSNQVVGQRTAAGFAQSNEPIPQSNHNPFPATSTADGIPSRNQPFDEVTSLRGSDPGLFSGDEPKQ
jgi:hypothetical protein